jgi:hypothetical protein
MDVWAVAGYIVGIISGLGALAAWFDRSRGRAVIELQKDTIDTFKEREVQLDKELAAKNAQLAASETQNKRLSELAQGSPQLVELTNQIKNLVEFLSKKK